MSDHISSFLLEHGSHISYMKPKYVTVQKHCINESFLVTIPYSIARAIPIAKGDIMKTSLDSKKRVIMEKA
ncbi:MAG: hypothetical protein ACRD5B_14285 [Nitrososphaeraceae archaeon]